MLSRFTSVRQRLTSLTAAAALAVAAIGVDARPAAASDDTLLKLLLGATAVAIIVHSASRAQGRSHVVHSAGYPQYCRETLSIHGRHVSVYNAQCLQQAGYRNLPARCHEVIRTNRGNRGVYRAQCLEGQAARPRGPVQTRGLPARCETRYRYRGQWHAGFSASCLHQAGLRQLPATCLVATDRGHVYASNCLRQHGHRHW